jgi:hypothetical protein
VKQGFFFILFLTISSALSAQSSDFLPHFEGQHHIEKQSVRSGRQFFSQFYPVSRQKAASLFVSDSLQLAPSHIVYRQASEYFENKETSQGLFGRFYKNEVDFFQLDQEDFKLTVNPVWQFQAGSDGNVSNTLFVNSRGLDVRGVIDNKISFHTRFLENQIEYPYYVKQVADTAGVIPFEGFWKEYNNTTTDFLRAFGSVSVDITPHIAAQLGYGRQFIGNGIRSVLLSDFANSYPYLKLDTEIWKFRYTNLFASLIADVFTYDQGTLGASRYPKKFMSAHYLDFAFTPNFHIGLFESIIFGQPDSIAPSRFQFEYLNPIIFYRSVEQQDGSSANAVMGATFQWNIRKQFMLYGQFLLDELVISELTAGNDWWGNKYSYQLGVQGYDLVLNNVDAKLEYNLSRPYTYAHLDYYTAYTHYRQPLAHPLGANFREVVGQLIYQPTDRLTFTGHAVIAAYGRDENGINSGRDPQRSYLDRPEDYGVSLLQGERVDLKLFQLRASYYWKYNLTFDVTGIFRQEVYQNGDPKHESAIINAGFRWNMPTRNYLF